MSYRREWTGNNVIFSFTGKVNYDDINKADSEIYSDSRFDLMNYCVFDFSLIEGFDLSAVELEVISTLDRSIARWNRRLKLALIGSTKEVRDMIIRYIHLMDQKVWDIKLFDHMDQALEWCLEK